MVYIEYEELKSKYLNAQRCADQIITEMERLFDKTQPKSTDFGEDRVSGGNYKNAFDVYLIEKERKNIDGRLSEVKAIINERQRLLKLKEAELRESGDINDRLYVFRYLEHMSVRKIISTLHYSETHIYRLLDRMQRNIKMGENGRNGVL